MFANQNPHLRHRFTEYRQVSEYCSTCDSHLRDKEKKKNVDRDREESKREKERKREEEREGKKAERGREREDIKRGREGTRCDQPTQQYSIFRRKSSSCGRR